jgi:ATP-dependent DNA helicase RecG
MTFDTPLAQITSIKKQTLAKLARMGIFTVEDMLYHFPSRYEDYSEIRSIDSLTVDEKCTGRTWKKKMFLTEVVIQDTSGQLRLIWFNQRFVSQTLKDGMEIRVSGKVGRDSKGLLMTNPAFERSSRDATHTGRLVPVYPETAGLTSKFFRWQLTGILQKLTKFPQTSALLYSLPQKRHIFPLGSQTLRFQRNVFRTIESPPNQSPFRDSQRQPHLIR